MTHPSPSRHETYEISTCLNDQYLIKAGQVNTSIVLCTINSRYSHTGLAVRLLAAYLRDHWSSAPPIHVLEMTIHEPSLRMLRKIKALNPAVVAFSCYIWNGDLIEKLTRNLKAVAPETIIIWGGPEASTRAGQIMRQDLSVDFIISGEGEIGLLSLLKSLYVKAWQKLESLSQNVLAAVPGLCWRSSDGQIRFNAPVNLPDGDAWSFPYHEQTLMRDKNRILYYESSRGCPFHCTYCLSAEDNQLRYRSVEKTCQDIALFLAHDVRQVKFVDRTFNANAKRAHAIWSYIIKRSRERASRTNFHFEIAADLLDQNAIELLAAAPTGLIQLEIGVQSTQPEVLAVINRPCRLDRLKENVSRLLAAGNIHLHLDLIAGLPGETLNQFAASFNDVFALNPHQLQLGFLKVLPGTPMAKTAETRSFSWQQEAPYEILQSDAMSFSDLCRLKDIAELIEGYWHQTDMVPILRFLITRAASPFSFFYALAGWFEKQGGFDRALSPADRSLLLWRFASANDSGLHPKSTDGRAFRDLIRYIYIAGGQKDQPDWLGFWEKQSADFKKNPTMDDADFIKYRLKLIEAARRRFHQIWPEIRRWRVDHFSFSVSHFEQTGDLKPGDTLVYYDLAQPKPCPLDSLEGKRLPK